MRITNHGRVIAIVEAAAHKGATLPAWGALPGSVRHIARAFDAPTGEADWEAAR